MTEKKKHYVFSARTTEEGLKILNKLKGSDGWDGFIISAIEKAHSVTIPRIELTGPSPEDRAKAKADKEAEKAAKVKEREDAKKVKAAEKAKKEADAKAKAEAETAPEPEPEQSEASQES